jgi:hypothetical protein
MHAVQIPHAESAALLGLALAAAAGTCHHTAATRVRLGLA